MENIPHVESSRSLDDLSESEIRRIFGCCEEEKRSLLLEMLESSNSTLNTQYNENAANIERMKQMNKILLKKTWESIECKSEAANFFKTLSKEFE